MCSQNCYQVTVRNGSKKVILDWTASFFTTLSVKTEGNKMIIAKKNLFGTETYMPNINESVKTRDWFSVQLQRYRSSR